MTRRRRRGESGQTIAFVVGITLALLLLIGLTVDGGRILSARERALGALVIVLSFCGYLAWLGGPGPYIGGLIAILDLLVMFGMFFGLRPERLPDAQAEAPPPPPRRRRRRF